MAHQCSICNKQYTRKYDLERHMNDKHNVDYSNRSPPHLRRISEIRSLSNERDDDNDARVVTRRANLPIEQNVKRFVFKHPSSILVVGPTRSGKTVWVTDLLINKEQRFHPSPDRIVYCYRHWQSSYTRLQHHDPTIRWHEGLPTTVLMDQFEDQIVVIADLMETGMNDSSLMSIFTEGSHHKNITVIFMVQNLFQHGRHARSMTLNAQYIVLFKNPRDQQQIRTLARQMYPTQWQKFLTHYEKETSRPYGKIIVDLNPETLPENRLQKDTMSTSNDGNDSRILNTLQGIDEFYQIEHPYHKAMRKKQTEMNELLKNAQLSESEKVSRYAELLKDFQTYQKKDFEDMQSGDSSNTVNVDALVSSLDRRFSQPSAVVAGEVVNSFRTSTKQSPGDTFPASTRLKELQSSTPSRAKLGMYSPSTPLSHGAKLLKAKLLKDFHKYREHVLQDGHSDDDYTTRDQQEVMQRKQSSSSSSSSKDILTDSLPPLEDDEDKVISKKPSSSSSSREILPPPETFLTLEDNEDEVVSKKARRQYDLRSRADKS